MMKPGDAVSRSVAWISSRPHMSKILIVVVLTISAAGSCAQTPQEIVQDAQQKQRAGDLEGAAAEYKQFLQLHPEATAIHSNLGAALAGLGRFEEAIAEYKIALTQSPGLPAAQLNLALCYYKMGRIQDASTELEKLDHEKQDNRQAMLLLADCYMRLGREEDVIRVLEPQEVRYPDDLAIAYLLGTAYIRQKRVAEGQVLVDRILRNGDSAEAHMMLGTAKMGVNDFAGARDEFAKAVAMNPNLPEVHVLYAKALMFSGDSDLSAKEFGAELRQDPYNFDANLQLGASAKQEQKNAEARKYFERAGETRPGDPGVRYQLALLTMEDGELDQAREILEALVRESPQFLEAHVSLAQVYYRLKRPEDGKKERDIVEKLTAEIQAKQPGVRQAEGKLQ
jgi:tetratricopeptide (TPR) repeat protein